MAPKEFRLHGKETKKVYPITTPRRTLAPPRLRTGT